MELMDIKTLVCKIPPYPFLRWDEGIGGLKNQPNQTQGYEVSLDPTLNLLNGLIM